MRPIDSDVVIRNLAVLERENEDFFEYCQEMKSLIRNTPTIEAEPVRHGRWVNKGDYAVCTECGGHSGTQYDGVEPIPLMTIYCGNCGAKMDGVG